MAKRRKFRLRLSSLILIVLVAWLGHTFGKGFIKHYRLRQEIAKLTYEIQAFERRNEKIREEIELHSSEEYIEQVAREELGLVKPGETRYIISEPLDE